MTSIVKKLALATVFAGGVAGAAQAGITCAAETTGALNQQQLRQVLSIHFDQYNRHGANMSRLESGLESINVVTDAECIIGPGAMFEAAGRGDTFVTTIREQNNIPRGGIYRGTDNREMGYVRPDQQGSGAPTMHPNPFR